MLDKAVDAALRLAHGPQSTSQIVAATIVFLGNAAAGGLRHPVAPGLPCNSCWSLCYMEGLCASGEGRRGR